ncbi:MAG: PAT family beta-lactamase induction signal transducer AmpG, partial [Myxococcota bacterium]
MNLLSSRYGRLATFFLLYITEGVPLGFSATALATAMRREGVSVEEIGLFVAALYAPWGFKWIFGPIVDLVGTRRSWILFAQVVMIVGLLGAVGIDYSANLKLFTAVMVIINTFCALQDVAIDALAVGTLKEEERGLGNGLMFAGAYVGQALGGAAMLALASRTGSMQPAFFAVAAMVGMVTIGVVLPMREPVLDRPKATLSQTSVAVAAYSRSLVRAMLLNRRSIAAAFFALLPAGAMAMGLALSTALAVELGLSDDRIAVLSLFGAITGATGSVVGGLISDRTGHRRTLAVYIALTSLPTLALAAAMQHYGWLIPVDPAAGLVPDDALLSMF